MKIWGQRCRSLELELRTFLKMAGATGTQLAEDFTNRYERKVLQHVVHHMQLHMRLHSYRPVPVLTHSNQPVLIPRVSITAALSKLLASPN